MEPAPLAAIRCPHCGGESPLPAGARLLACPFCEAALFVDRAGAVGHYRLPRLLDAAQAEAALRRWMAGNETVRGLDREAAVESLAPVTFPMWLFRSRGRQGEVVHVEPAAPTPIGALADLEIPAGRLEPYRAEAAEVTEIVPQVPLATARGWLDQRGAGEVLESALVRVPLWRCTYRYRERSFDALVEGSTGAVVANVFPEKAEAPFVLVMGLGALLFGLEGLLLTNLLLKLAAYAITAIPLTFAAYWVARRV